MTIEKQIEIANVIIKTKLCNQVFIDCQLYKNDAGIVFPVYKNGTEQYYIGPSDEKGMYAYIRENGAARKTPNEKMGSCTKSYLLSIPHRAVFFKDHEDRNFELLKKKLMSFVFLKHVELTSFLSDAFTLAAQESPVGDFSFDASTFYFAVDFNIKTTFAPSSCDEDFCKHYKNPICHELLL